VLVRTWNLFNGNTVPPGRRAHLRAMIELITADRPDAVCLQEVPAWALEHVGGWAGMQSAAVRSMRPRVGPIRLPAVAGRALTSPSHGLFRSAFAGQGNVILFPREAKVRAVKSVTLNTTVFCEERGVALGLSAKDVRAWQKERRVCHYVQYELPGRQRLLVANVHATAKRNDPRLADAELRRATTFVDRGFEVDQPLILAGDFNLTSEQSDTVRQLLTAPPESRWQDLSPGIDQVMVREATLVSTRVWPEAEREFDGRLLSDHTPVEAEIE
jgi:endonuclease/exonuclease/phosphatase family metal-dependent hydrolase